MIEVKDEPKRCILCEGTEGILFVNASDWLYSKPICKRCLKNLGMIIIKYAFPEVKD